MRSINIKGLFSSSKLQNHFFLCQDSISSPLPVFSQNPSLLRRNPRSPTPLSGSVLSKRRLSVTNCFFLPHLSLERAGGQVGMRSRQGSNSSRGENVNWLDGGEPGNSSEGGNVQVAKLCWGSSPGEPDNSSGGENLTFLLARKTWEWDEILLGHSRFASLENLIWELKGESRAILVKMEIKQCVKMEV